jgi:hypothetical protein
MKKNKKIFREFLNTFYKNSITKDKDKKKDDFVSKVNNCILRFVNDNLNVVDFDASIIEIEPIKKPQNKIIILPSGCYSKMIESDDVELYGKCLSQFKGINDEIISNIIGCVRGGKMTCTTSAIVRITKSGNIQYTNCCGSLDSLELSEGENAINNCLVIGSIKPSDKKGNPAEIGSIDYSGGKCICDNKQ